MVVPSSMAYEITGIIPSIHGSCGIEIYDRPLTQIANKSANTTLARIHHR